MYSFQKNTDIDNEQHQNDAVKQATKSEFILYDKKKKNWKRESWLISSADIRKLNGSELTTYCKSVLQSFRSNDVSPSRTEFNDIPDYMLMHLCLENGTRASTLAKMTIRDVSLAKLISGAYHINVDNHKTHAVSGPDCIVIRNDLFQDFLIYHEKMRSFLPGVTCLPEDPVFITWTGQKMSSYMVDAQINSYGKRQLVILKSDQK